MENSDRARVLRVASDQSGRRPWEDRFISIGRQGDNILTANSFPDNNKNLYSGRFHPAKPKPQAVEVRTW